MSMPEGSIGRREDRFDYVLKNLQWIERRSEARIFKGEKNRYRV